MRGSPRESAIYCGKEETRISENDLQEYITVKSLRWTHGPGPFADGQFYFLLTE